MVSKEEYESIVTTGDTFGPAEIEKATLPSIKKRGFPVRLSSEAVGLAKGVARRGAVTDVRVEVVYEHLRDEFLFYTAWKESNGSSNRGRVKSFRASVEEILASGDPDNYVSVLIDDHRPEMPEQLGAQLWSAWMSVRRFGLDGDEPESVEPQFPETAGPVLARLKAEVEMCGDELQQSRLQAIYDLLEGMAPAEASQ